MELLTRKRYVPLFNSRARNEGISRAPVECPNRRVARARRAALDGPPGSPPRTGNRDRSRRAVRLGVVAHRNQRPSIAARSSGMLLIHNRSPSGAAHAAATVSGDGLETPTIVCHRSRFPAVADGLRTESGNFGRNPLPATPAMWARTRASRMTCSSAFSSSREARRPFRAPGYAALPRRASLRKLPEIGRQARAPPRFDPVARQTARPKSARSAAVKVEIACASTPSKSSTAAGRSRRARGGARRATPGRCRSPGGNSGACARAAPARSPPFGARRPAPRSARRDCRGNSPSEAAGVVNKGGDGGIAIAIVPQFAAAPR